MSGKIRNFTDRDYQAITDVHNAAFAEWPDSAEDFRHADATRESKCKWQRYVYEEDGLVVGYGGYSQSAWMYHPRKFWAYVVVHPERRGRGVGAAVYDHVMERLLALGPISVRNEINESHPEAIRFAEKRGFKAGMREQESGLDLTRFDPAAFEADLERAREAGIEIKEYEELAADPECHRKLWELDTTVSPDMPSPEPITQPKFENYCKHLFEHPKFFPAGFMVALDGEAYVGMSNLYLTEKKERLHTGLTGVRREYRKRGLATALKVATLAKVKALGYESVLTWNDSSNAGMLGINYRLGFEKRPAWIDFEKVIAEEES